MTAALSTPAAGIDTRFTDGAASEYDAIRHGVGLTRLHTVALIVVSGRDCTAAVDAVVAGNVERLLEGTIRWSVILDDDGRVVSDVQVYKDFHEILLACDNSARAAVLAALERGAAEQPDARVIDRTEELSAIAIEGPAALEAPRRFAGPLMSGLPFLKHMSGTVDDVPVRVARISHVGEYGYVVFVPTSHAEQISRRISAELPAAVECVSDVHAILRLEVRAFNLRRDIIRGETALEAGLHWMIDFRKGAFPGRAAVMSAVAAGSQRSLVAFVSHSRTVPERGAPVLHRSESVGYIANVAWSPTAQAVVGLAYLNSGYGCVDLPLRAALGESDIAIRTVSAPMVLTESSRRTTS